VSAAEQWLLESIWSAAGGASDPLEGVRFEGATPLSSRYPVGALASASIAASGLAIAELIELRHGTPSDVRVDRMLAGAWFGRTLQPEGWTLPPLWDEIAGDYQTADGGWIRLHTNAPEHRAAAIGVLGLGEPVTRDQATAAARTWAAVELEAAVVAAGGCAAQLRSPAQ